MSGTGLLPMELDYHQKECCSRVLFYPDSRLQALGKGIDLDGGEETQFKAKICAGIWGSL